jgi:hypothetical protein
LPMICTLPRCFKVSIVQTSLSNGSTPSLCRIFSRRLRNRNGSLVNRVVVLAGATYRQRERSFRN